MNLNPNFKLINYFTIVSDLFNKEGPDYIYSKNIETAVKSNPANLVIKLLFSIAYEIQDAYPTSIEDNKKYCEKVREYLNYIHQSLETEEEFFMYFLGMSFTYQYKVFPNITLLSKYVKANSNNIEEAKIIIKDSIENLRLALLYLQKAGDGPRDNVILSSMIDFERRQLISSLRGHLQKNTTPDIESVIVFYDQLENKKWWDTFTDLTIAYIYKPT